jgi:hypothetical protein
MVLENGWLQGGCFETKERDSKKNKRGYREITSSSPKVKTNGFSRWRMRYKCKKGVSCGF